MKFIMVVLICFGVDCEAIFDESAYNSYEECYQVSLMTSQYMQHTFPQSSGEVHCFTEQQFSEFEKMLENGKLQPTFLPKDLPSV